MHYPLGMIDFWNNVKAELEYRMMTQKELAAQTEISYNTFQSWITKDRLPDAADSVRIAKILGVTVEYLVTGQASANEPIPQDSDRTARLGEKYRRTLRKLDSIPDGARELFCRLIEEWRDG